MRLFGKRDAPADDGSPSPARENLEAARAALQSGDASESLRLLTFGFAQDAAFKPLYEAARDALKQLGAPEEATLFQRALSDFARAKPFYDLGYHFVGAGHDRMALPFLERAHTLAPGDVEIANELSLALCGQFQPQRAAQILGEVLEPLSPRPFWPAYQWHWARLLSNQRAGTAEWIEEARAILDDPRLNDDQRAGISFALGKLEAVLRRLESVPDPRPLIRDWHFIQYGAAVLDLMDDSVTEGGLEVAGGRHVASWGQNEDVRRVLEKLKQFLAATGQAPQSVVALEDRDSQIIGLAAAQVLALPFEVASEQNIARPNALVVTGDNRSIDWDELRTVAPGQVLFAWNQHWLEPGAITPDVCGVISQTYGLPWQGGGISVSPDGSGVTESEADEREPEAIAADIAPPDSSSGFEPEAEWQQVLAFFAERRALLANAQAGAPRLPFLTDSPVPGSYFC